MKILVISNSGDFSPVAYRIMNEGVDISIYIHSLIYKKCYNGMLPKVTLPGLRKAIKASDIVIFDMNKSNETKEDRALLKLFKCSIKSPGVFGPVADKIRSMGKKVIGASTWTEKIELDRYLGEKVAKKIGIKIPDTIEFNKLSDGVKFLKLHSGSGWVFKPSNNLDLDLTYVEHFTGELIQKMGHEYKSRLGDKVNYILQQKVNGVEISTEGWFDGNEFVSFNHTLENKKLMSGNLGLSIGSQSNLVWIKKNMNGLLVEEIKKLSPYLKKVKYIGPFDINCIVDTNGIPNYLENTPRMGYDSIQNLMNLLDTNISDFYLNDFQGNFFNGYSASERVTIPPFPYTVKSLLKDFAKDVLVGGDISNTYLEDVYMATDNQIRCSGADGIIGACAAKNTDTVKVWDGVYNNISKLRISSDMQYRMDSKNNITKRLMKLQKLGVVYD